MNYFGVDPGKKGGLAVLDDEGRVMLCQPMPVILGRKKAEYHPARIFDRFARQGEGQVYIEKLSPMPAKYGGAATNYQRGYAMGLFEAICVALKLRYEFVPPSRWQKVFWKTADDTKQQAIMLAQRFFPDVDLLPTEQSRKPHDGMADALLIAEYGRRHANGLLT